MPLRRVHPKSQLRWRLAQLSTAKLLAGTLLAEIVLSLALSTGYVLTRSSHDQQTEFDSGHRVVLRLFFAAFRSVLGVETFPYQQDNTAQQLLSTIASVIGVLTPAVIVSIAVIRLFTVRPIHWRHQLNACLVSDIRPDLSRLDPDEPDDFVVLGIRFYRRFAKGFHINDLRAVVYLRFPIVSKVDGSTFFRQVALTVLDSTGEETPERRWPQMGTSMPFTVWVPLHASLGLDGQVVNIQGTSLNSLPTDAQPALYVTLQGRIVGLGLELNSEHRYELNAPIQQGRPVSVNPEPGYYRKGEKTHKRWQGWDRFDEAATYGIFVYGSLVNPVEMKKTLGRVVELGKDYFPAKLSGWRRSWSIGTDNMTSPNVTYLDPATGGKPAISVHFLNIDRVEGEAGEHVSTDGLLIRVSPEEVAAFDQREANYDRKNVTNLVDLADGYIRPDVVWTYVGKPARVESALRAIEDGSARIRTDYWSTVKSAFDAYPGGPMPIATEGIPVVPLQRVSRDEQS